MIQPWLTSSKWNMGEVIIDCCWFPFLQSLPRYQNNVMNKTVLLNIIFDFFIIMHPRPGFDMKCGHMYKVPQLKQKLYNDFFSMLQATCKVWSTKLCRVMEHVRMLAWSHLFFSKVPIISTLCTYKFQDFFQKFFNFWCNKEIIF